MPDFTDAPLDSSWLDSAGSALKTGWRWATTPLLPQIQQATRGISDAITSHSANESRAGSMARGAIGGMIEGAGNVLGDFTSPLGIATAALPKLLSGIRGARGAASAATEALGGRSASDVLLGGPTTEAQAQEILLGNGKESSIDELIRQLDRTPQGSREVGGVVPPRGSVGPDVAEGRIPATELGEPEQVHIAHGTPAPAYTDAPVSDTWETALRDFEGGAQPHAVEPPAPPAADLGAAGPRDPLDVLREHFELPQEAGSAVETRPGAVSSEAAPTSRADLLKGRTGTSPETDRMAQQFRDQAAALREPETPAPPSSPDEVLRRFFRFDEAPITATGKRRLLPEEVTREQGLRDTNLGDERGTPSVPSQFVPRGETSYRDLPFGERTKQLADDSYYKNLLDNESGFVDPAAVKPLAEAANKWRYFSMLSSPGTQAKNILGNVGAVGSHAAETALSGRPRDALKVLTEFFNPQTVRDALAEYRDPGIEGRWGSESGPLGVPGRIMGAIDRGTKDALARAGVPRDLAEEITFTNRPKSEVGQALGDALNKSSIGKLLVPFSKTATNILERGIERTPILGSIAQKASAGNLTTSIPKQILGGVAMAGGAALAHQDPYLDALLAPYSVPYAIGSGAATAAEKAGSTSADVVQAIIGKLADAAPLPTKDYTLDPRTYAASYVPNILRDVNPLIGTDPASFDTGRHSGYPFLGKALAKIPFFNELLLHHKTVNAPAAKPAR